MLREPLLARHNAQDVEKSRSSLEAGEEEEDKLDNDCRIENAHGHSKWNKRRASLMKNAIYVLLLILTYVLGTWTGSLLFRHASNVVSGTITYVRNHVYEEPFGPCAKLSVQLLDDLHEISGLGIRAFVNGREVAQEQRLQGTADVCLIVTVPQHPPSNQVLADPPVPGKGPDNIHLIVNSTSMAITFPPLRPLPSQKGLDMILTSRTLLYYAEVRLDQSGDYAIYAEREWANWIWAQEWNFRGASNTYHYESGATVPFGDFLGYTFKPEEIPLNDQYPMILHVDGLTTLPNKPTCGPDLTAANGKWYKQESYPELQAELVDEWGYGWEGDQCRTDYYSADDMFDCLEDKTIHMFGDSMLRRHAKTIISGATFCHDVNDVCQTSDNRNTSITEKLTVNQDGDMVREIVDESDFEAGAVGPITFGKNSSIYFNFLGRITQVANWMDKLYDQEDMIDIAGDRFERVLKEGAKARSDPTRAKADLVMLGFGAWDSCFDVHFDKWDHYLPKLRDAMSEAYKDIPFSLRLANSYCCRGTSHIMRRYTGTRVQHYDDIMRDVFQVDGARALNGTIAIVDPNRMNGRLDVIRDYGDPTANHPRMSHMRIEVQMLLNSVCERDDRGKARLRKLPGSAGSAH